MRDKINLLGTLFFTFFRIGLFTFGGGYAMIPLIETDVVEKHGWIDHETLLDIIAIAESTPGPLAVNCATFIGCRMGGFQGAALSTLGVTLPSFLIILLVSMFFTQFRDNQWVAWAFEGVRAGVVALMLNAVIKLGKHMPQKASAYTILGAAFVLAAFTPIDVIYVLILAAVTGIVLMLVNAKGGEAG